MKKIVYIRHGESVWNAENKFTGWTNVDLSDRGVREAHEAGKILKEEGYVFDRAYTSWLVRAQHTLDIVLEELGQTSIPVKTSWRLNERHYGALQGLNKSEMAQKYGEEQVKIWRRSFDIQPPALETSDERHPVNDLKYKEVDEKLLPATESMKDVIDRIVPYWEHELKPMLENVDTVLISAHGNTIRGFKMFLDKMRPEDIVDLNIPYATPLVYEFNDDMTVAKSYYLGDQERIKAVAQEVSNQARVL